MQPRAAHGFGAFSGLGIEEFCCGEAGASRVRETVEDEVTTTSPGNTSRRPEIAARDGQVSPGVCADTRHGARRPRSCDSACSTSRAPKQVNDGLRHRAAVTAQSGAGAVKTQDSCREWGEQVRTLVSRSLRQPSAFPV